MNKYFDVGGKRFKTREEAVEQVKEWRADTTEFYIHEVTNTEVTRISAKGNVLTEVVRGNLGGVPRVVSIRELPPTYAVLRTEAKSVRYHGDNPHFATRVEAEIERAKRRSRIEALAALTETDIREVRVPTLDDILERDADKIEDRQAEAEEAGKELQLLEADASASVASALADLDKQAAVLKAEAAKQFEIAKAQEEFDAAVQALHEIIHFDELEGKVLEKIHEIHELDCWPDSHCREHGECTFEPDSDDVAEYLIDHADEFEIKGEIAGEAGRIGE